MYKEMHNILNDGQIGNFKLEKYTIEKDNIFARMQGIPTGNYIKLQDTSLFFNSVIMSNTPMEKRTNNMFISKANGDVFIAGLGIGLIILPLLENENVKSITVLEKYSEIIELVGKQLPLTDKIKVIQGDVFEYEFPKGTKFDTLYFDIWNGISTDVYEEMKLLKKKYRKNRRSITENQKSFVACWAEYEAKNNRPLW